MKTVLSVAVLAVVVACGSKEVATGVLAASCILRGPTVSPASAVVVPGDSIQLSVTSVTAYGCGASPTSFTWRSSAPAIASVGSATGVVQALTAGSVTITAIATIDTTVRGAAVVTVGLPCGACAELVIRSVSYVSNGKPANLDSLAGVVQVDAIAGSFSGGSQTAELVIVRAGGDTVVASSTIPAPVPQVNTHSLRWNTDARTASGSRVFANGPTAFRVRLSGSGSSTVVNSTTQQATLKNP